jgi:hypothetical protein
MTNVISNGAVIARTTSGNVVPIWIVPEAVGDGTTDDTAAFNAAIALLPATGGTILLEAGKRYAVNLVIDRDGITFVCQGGGGDGNVLTGLVPFNSALPALKLGAGTAQRRKFTMIGGRIYSQSGKNYGLQINGFADVNFFGTEIGGFSQYALQVTSTASANSYFINFHGCKFFGVSGMTSGSILDLAFGSGFVTTVNLIGGNVDGSALGGATDFTGPRAISIGDQVQLWTQGTHCQLRHAKGVKINGTGRWHASGGIVDTSDTPSTAVLLEIPSTELNPGSFLLGADLRFNGCMRNTTPTVVDLRGNNNFGHGFLYSPQVFEPRMIGWLDLIPTFQAAGIRMTPIAGSPEGVLAGNPGDLAISVNNVGSSNGLFHKSQANIGGDATKGWLRLASGDYFRQTGPSVLTAAATVDLLHDAGDFNFISGSATITSLGTDADIQSGRVRRAQIAGTPTFTHTASPTGGQMYCLGQQSVPAQAGDIVDWLWQGAGSGWRMLAYQRFDGRPFRPARGAYADVCTTRLRWMPTQANAAAQSTLLGASSEIFFCWDFDQTTVQSIDGRGVFDARLLAGGTVFVSFLAFSPVTSGNIVFKGAFRRLVPGTTDLDATVGDYATNALSSGSVAIAGTAGVPVLVTIGPFSAGAQLDSCVAGSRFVLRLSRDTSVGSNVAGLVRIDEDSIEVYAA